MPVDHIEEALSQLDVGERALLDLSVHRGFDDERIAKLLDIEVSQVSAQRHAALEKLFRLRAASGDGARDAVQAELRSVSDSTWIDPPTAAPRSRRSRRPLIAAAIAVVAAAAVAVLLLAGGGDSDTSGGGKGGATAGSAQTGSKPVSPAPAPPGGVALKPLSAGTPGRVTATVSGAGDAERLTVRLRGLAAPKGAYELWLYDSLVHSRALGSVSAGEGTISARLPGDAASYSWLDLSLQPGADRAHHSGESVFRAPLDQVTGGGQR